MRSLVKIMECNKYLTIIIQKICGTISISGDYGPIQALGKGIKQFSYRMWQLNKDKAEIIVFGPKEE